MNYYVALIDDSDRQSSQKIFVERLEEQDINFACFFPGSWLIVDRHDRVSISDLRTCIANIFGASRRSLVLEVDPKSSVGMGPDKLSSWLEKKWPVPASTPEANT